MRPGACKSTPTDVSRAPPRDLCGTADRIQETG